MKAALFDYHRARGLQDALATLADGDGDAKAMAGGCSLGPMLNLRLARPAQIVDLRHVPELRRIEETEDRLVIGALWTHAEIEDGALPDVTNGFLPFVAHGIAYRAVRNRGTIGGSVAHADPAADWITTLLTLDARLLIHAPDGVRQASFDTFMLGGYSTELGDDELLTGIVLPKLSGRGRWAYHKICRKTGEFAKAIGAVLHDPDRGLVRVVCGAIERTPILLEETSAALGRAGPEAAATVLAPVLKDEIDRRLADHDAVFRQMHHTAVSRALAELGSK